VAAQAARIAAARGADEAEVRALIDGYTRQPFPGLYSEPAVNVLAANLALDAALGAPTLAP
jgi:K+-transporting ATPase ATPase C chain